MEDLWEYEVSHHRGTEAQRHRDTKAARVKFAYSRVGAAAAFVSLCLRGEGLATVVQFGTVSVLDRGHTVEGRF
jgi:hypothetical protein